VPKPAGPVARKSDYKVVAIPFAPKVKTARAQEARKLLREQHYACGGPNTAVLMAGLVRKDTDELVGVAQFLPTSPPGRALHSSAVQQHEPEAGARALAPGR